MSNLDFIISENNVTMNREKSPKSPFTPFQIHQIYSPGKIRRNDSPTSSILKTPTAIFVTTRNSSAKTKKLKFANGPVDLQTLRNGTHESNEFTDSGVEVSEVRKSNSNGTIFLDDSSVEVAISPVKTMQVSPESWKVFQEYKKYNDYSNETEKTDYTYSRLSKFRHKEIIPGFSIRPNLSRSPIYSHRLSISLPPSESSFNESSYQSGYDFKVHNQPNSEVSYYFKTPNQTSKSSRSKYYLRSMSYDDTDINEVDRKPLYLESEYYSNSVPEKFTKTTTYSTSEVPESTSEYFTKVRSLGLDDADIDEVDDNPLQYEKHHYGNAWLQERPRTFSDRFSNFFANIFMYVTSVGTLTKGLFSKHILRRQDDLGHSSSIGSIRYENLGYGTGGGSWIPWARERVSSTTGYSGGYYGSHRSWYQQFFDYFSNRFSSIKNLIVGDNVGYYTSRYHQTSNRRKFWWLLIPLLILAGSFLGYIDFFSNPKAILNTMYNWLFFIPSFLHYTVMVFIPRLFLELIPYFILTVIPNFLTVTLPYFFLKTVPHYFWVIVQFFASLSIVNVWNGLLGLFSTLFNFTNSLVWAAGNFVYNLAFNSVSLGYSLSARYLMLFYSTFCTQMFTLSKHLLHYVFYSFDLVSHVFNFIFNLF